MEHEGEYPVIVAQDGPLKGERWSLDHTLMIGRDPLVTFNFKIGKSRVFMFASRPRQKV